MGLVFSHAISAALFYLRPQRALGDGNGKENKLIFDGLLEECLLPVVDAESPTELREAVRQGVSRCLGSNSSQVKVYLKTPVSGSLVDDNGRSLPSTGFINEVLSQRGKTIINASKNQDSIPDLSSNQHSNDSNGSTSAIQVYSRDPGVDHGFLRQRKCYPSNHINNRITEQTLTDDKHPSVETSASNISNSETKRLELCIKQASVTYEAIKARRAKETEATPASLLSLIQLCSDLNDQDAVKLQQKVIRYLCKHTGAKTGFILLVVPETHELFCQTVGDIPLQEELRYADGHSDFAQALETRQPLRITDLKEDGILTVEKIVGFPLKSFLCVPVSVSDGKELLALTCLVNKENDQEFDNDDTEIVTQCFKYTATVLSSTLAFQNERKLKNQTQALLQVAKKLFTRLGKFTSSKTSFSPRVIFNPTDTCKINDGLIVCDESSINRSSKGLQESEPYDISNSSMDFIEQKTNEQSDEIDKMTSISEQEHRIRMQETKHLAVKAKVYDRTTPMEEEQSVLFGLDERLQDQSSTKFGVESNDKDDEMSFKQNCLPSLVNSSTMLCHLSHQLHEKLYHHMQCLKQLQEKLENKVDTRLTISCNASRSDDKSKREDALDSQEETTTLLMCQIKCLVESISNFESGQEDKYWKTVDRTVQTMSESDEACPMGWEFDVQNNYTSKNINIDVGSEMSSQQENGTRHGNETDSIAGRLNEKLDETHNSGGKWSLKVYVTDIVTDLVEKSMDLASVNGSVAPPVTDQTFGDGEMMCFGRSLSDEDLDVVDANVDITAWKMEVTTEKTDTFGVNMDASNCLHYSIADIEEIIDEEGKKSDSSNGIQYPWSNGGCRERDADVLSTLSMSNDAMTKVDCDIIPLIKDFEKQDESGIVAMDGLLPLSVQDSVASMDSKKSIDSELPLSEHDNEGIDMPSDSFHHIASDVENEIDSEGNVEEYCVNDDFQTWLNMSYSVHKDDISFIPNLDVLTDSYSMLEDLSESDMSKSEENNRFVLDGERKIISYEGNDNKDKKKPYCESVSSYYSISGDSVDEDVYDFDSSDYHHNSCEENNEDNETFNKDNSSGVICFQSKDKTFPVFNVTTEMSFDRSEEMVSDTHKNVCIDHESPKNDEFCQAGKICHFVENRITNNIDNGIEPQSNRNWSCWEDMFGGESHIFEELRISTCSGQENSKIVNEEIKDFEETDDDKPMAQSTPKSSSDFHKNVFERGDLSPASTISFIDKASDFLKLDTDGEKALEANVMCCPNDNDVHSCQSYVTVEETDDTDSFKNDMCSSEKDDMLLQHVGFECQNLVDQDIIHTLQDFPSGIIKDGLSQYYDSQTQEIQNEHQSIEGLDDYQLQKFQEVLSELKSLKISVDSQSLKVSKEHLSMENSVESQSLVVSIRPQLLEVANQLHPVSQDVREEHQSQRDSNDCAFFEVLNWTQSLEVSGEPQFQEVSDKSLSLLSLEVSGKSQPLEVPDTLHLAEVSNDPYSQTVSDESSCVEFPNEYQPWKVPDTPQHLKISNGHQIRVLDEPQSLVLQECHPQEILYEFHCLGCTSEFQPLDILYETQSKSHDILDEPHTLDISDVPPSQTVPDDSPSHPSHEYNSQKVHLDEVVHIPENSDCPEVDLFSKNDDTVFSDNASQTPSDSIFASCDECQQDFEISMSRAPRSDKSAVESPKQEPGICNDTFLEKSFVCVSDDEYHKVSESISYSPHQLDPFLEGRNEIKDQISSLNASVDEIQNQTFVLPENENKSEDQISTKLESSNEIYDQFCQLDKSHNQAKDQISSLSISNDKKHSLILSQVECPEILSRIFFENDKLVSLTENNDIKDSKTIGSSDGSQDVISLPHDETEDEHCPCFIAVDKISDLNSLSCESNILNQDLNFTCHNRIDEIKNLNSSYTVNHGEIQEPDSSLDHNEDEIRDINSSHTVNHGEIQEPDSSLDHNEDEIQNLNSSHTVNHGEIQEPDSSLDHNQDEIQDINSSYTVNHGEIQEPDSSLDHNQDEIQDIDSSLQFSSEQIHDHNSSLYDYDDEIQYFSSPPCNLNSSLHGSNCEIQYFDSSLHNNNNGINELDSWLHHSNDKVHDCTSSLHDSSDEIHNLNSPCHDCSDEIHNLNPPCCDSSDEIHNLNSPCHDSNDEIHDINGSFHDNTDEIHINSSHYHSIGETQELNSPQHDSNNEFHELDFSFHDSNGEIQDENYIMQFKQKSPVLECNDGVFDITFSVPEIEFNVEDQVSVEFDINHESTQNYNSPSHESSSDQVKDSNSALLDNSDERKNLNFPLHKKKNEIHPLSQTSTFPQHHHELKNSKSCVSRICDQIIDQKSKEEESTPDQTYVFPQKDQTSIEIHDNHNKTLDYGSALVGDEIVNVIKPVRLCHPFYTPLCENHDIPHALPSQDQNGFENTELFSKQHHAYAHSGWNDDNGSEAEPALNPSIVSKGSSALDVTGPYESDLFSEEDQAFDGDVSCLDETCHTRGLGDEALLEMWDRTYDMTFSKPVTVSDTYCGYDYFNLSNAYQPYSNTRMVYASSTSNSSTQNHGIVSEKGIYDGLNACLDNVHPIPEVCFESEGICKMDKFKPIVHIKACHESCQDKKRAEGKFNFQYLDALRVSDEDRISLPRTKSNDFSCKLDCDGSSLKRVVNSKELKDVEDFVNGETFTMCPGGDSINYNEHNVRRTLKYFPDVCYNSDEDKMMETIPEDEKSIVFERTNNELQKSDHAKSVNDVLSNIFMNKSDVLSESDSSLPYEPRIDKMNLDTETSHDKNAKDSYTFYSDSVIEPRRILFDWDFKKSQREYQVVTSHNSHPTIESALLNNETIPKSSKDKFEGINEQNEIEMKLTNDDVIRCQNTVHENVCNTNRLALVPLGIDAVMEQNAFQCNDFEEVDTNMDITPIEINYEPFLEVNRSFNRVLHTSDLEVISEEESDENSHASLSLNNLETSEHSEGMDSSSGDQENVFGDKDVFYKSDLIQNDKHDDLCESELSQNNDTDYLPSIHNTTFTAEDNDYKAYFFPPVLIDPETEIVRKDNIKKVNEGVNDDVFEEDDLNASSEAYSDNMERLGSSEDHLLIDSSDSRSGDSDILKHTSSDLNLTRSDDQFLLDKNWVYEYEERHAVSKKKQYLFDCSYEINGKKFVGSKVKRVDHCVTYHLYDDVHEHHGHKEFDSHLPRAAISKEMDGNNDCDVSSSSYIHDEVNQMKENTKIIADEDVTDEVFSCIRSVLHEFTEGPPTPYWKTDSLPNRGRQYEDDKNEIFHDYNNTVDVELKERYNSFVVYDGNMISPSDAGYLCAPYHIEPFEKTRKKSTTYEEIDGTECTGKDFYTPRNTERTPMDCSNNSKTRDFDVEKAGEDCHQDTYVSSGRSNVSCHRRSYMRGYHSKRNRGSHETNPNVEQFRLGENVCDRLVLDLATWFDTSEKAEQKGTKEGLVKYQDIIGSMPVYYMAALWHDDLTKLLREIMQEARNLTDAERCSVFLLDKDSDELVAMVFDGITAEDKERLLRGLRTRQDAKKTVQGEIRLPKTQGIAGHVATTGTLLNIRDAYSHPLFYRGIDDSTGFRTRNILCFPIKDEDGVVLGVAQLCNKKTFQYFTTFDEDVASAFAVYCCISISHSLMYKKVIDIQYRNSLANELMMFHMKSLMYKKLQDTQHRQRLANDLMMFHLNQQVPGEEVTSMANMTIPSIINFSPSFDTFDYAPRTIPECQTVLACLSMFEDLGFSTRWRIKLDTLVRFVLMVKKGYRNPPYHNWMHAFAVTHFCYLLIKNLHLQNYLEDIELLALFVSCMCHDIDHRGTTNSFQVQSQTVLAALYSSEGSVMERHHLAQSMCILNTEGSNLFEQLSSKEYQTVLDLMKEIILATDLAHHLRSVKEQDRMSTSDDYDKNNPTDRYTLLCLLMTACDLSDQTKNWNNTKLIASLVYQEFFSQGDLEKALGKNPMEMMDRERACIPELQIAFLDNIAAPVYKILVQMFPEAEVVQRNVEDNRKHWVHIRELLKSSKQVMSVEEIISLEEEPVDELKGNDINVNNNMNDSCATNEINGR